MNEESWARLRAEAAAQPVIPELRAALRPILLAMRLREATDHHDQEREDPDDGRPGPD